MGCTIFPGVFDGISTHIANNAGFHALYLACSRTSGSRLGEPDTAYELANAARMMVGVSNVPIVADADTGFGGPLNVARTIALYESAGVAGCHIEDQTFRMSVNSPCWNFLLTVMKPDDAVSSLGRTWWRRTLSESWPPSKRGVIRISSLSRERMRATRRLLEERMPERKPLRKA